NAQAGLDDRTRPWAMLAEAMAAFAVQTLERPLAEVIVGASSGIELEPLRLHALVGALKVSLETPVNAINAPGLAEERGWISSARRIPEGQPPILRLTLRAGEEETTLEGHHTPAYGPRVTRVDGFEVDFRPQGRFLVTHHDDVPGILAAITAELARHELNVGNVSLARQREGAHAGTALAVIQIDGAIPAAVRDALRETQAVHAAHRVRVLA
ncbi:MAG TPA: ACT domain-containing protein, partial [Candidatus Thermoplasmatota archaeon]|nr:ACT domain-containing protein [Candidatus Thermoplasmatota archaeon]